MTKIVTILLIMTVALFACVASVSAESTGTKVKITAPEIKKPDQPVERPQAKSQTSSNYDSFKDDNKNGIDDRFEKAEKLKVKVQEIKDKSKPTKQAKKEEPKTKPSGN